MKLWRPIGQKELNKIEVSDMRAFPPRLPEQPIFYPVLSFEYAERIARDWNSVREDHDYVGFVVAFEVEDAFISRYPAQIAGGKDCEELWVPAEELDEFNRHIIGGIKIVAEYRNGARVQLEPSIQKVVYNKGNREQPLRTKDSLAEQKGVEYDVSQSCFPARVADRARSVR